MISKLAVALGPVVVFRIQRVKIYLEPVPVVMPDRRPHHLAHELIAQVARQVADAQPPRTTDAWWRKRLAVHALRHRVVRAIQAELRFRLDIEVEKQEQELLEAVGEVGFGLGLELVLPQPVEIAVQPGKVASILIDLECLDRERKRARTVGLESLEDP